MAAESFMANSKRGLCLVIEGVDGIGKSTVVPMVATLLRTKTGRTVRVCREPGGTPTGEAIRGILLGENAPKVSGTVAAMLFSAARKALFEEVIKPAVERGEIILLDRFVLSTYVYQGEQGVKDQEIDELTKIACGGLWPDSIIVLTLDPKELQRRRSKRASAAGADQFDSAQTSEVGVKRQERYIALANSMANGAVVDVGDTPENNARRIVEAMDNIVQGINKPGRGMAR